MRRIFLFLIIFLPLFSAQAYQDSNSVEIKELENGMVLCVVNSPRYPIVTHMILYEVGGNEDGITKTGLAHLLEHMMFRGTKDEKNIFSVLTETGNSFNAFTSSYVTAYYATVPKNSLSLIMSLEADRMTNLTMDKNDFLKERDIVLEERRMRYESTPQAQMIEHMESALFKNNRSWNVIGWSHEISNLSVYDANKMYREYYKPKNAVLVIAGDITMEEALPLVKKHFGSIKNKDISKRDNNTSKRKRRIAQEPDNLTQITLTMEHELLNNNPSIEMWSLVPSISQDLKSSLSLFILQEIFSKEDASNLLYKNLVMEENLSFDVQSYYNPFSMSDVKFTISTNLKDKKDKEKAVEIINKSLKDMAENGIEDNILRRAKNAIKIQNLYIRENTETLATLYGFALVMKFPTDVIQDFEQNIEDIKHKDIQDALAKFLAYDKNKVIGYLVGEN